MGKRKESAYMIKINPYYRTEEDLNKAEEPFMSITRILERLYLDGVNGKKDVSYSFKNTYAVSCMRDFAEDLAKKQTTFVSRLNYLWGSLMHPNKQFSNSFDSYGVPYERYQGIIFGGVYYVLAKQKSVSVDHLDMLSSFVSSKAEALPYFNVYKEAAKPNVSEQSQDMTTLRKQFIRGLNSNPDIVDKVDWADVTIAFNRSVMAEIFWGVENDDVLKAVCKNIINTWNKLYEKKDPRCYDEVVTGKGVVMNLDPWKFGGLTKEPIGVFFSKLWVERNAKTTYRNFGGDTDSATEKPKSDPTVSDEEAIAKIQELEEKLQAKSKEYDAMKADNEQLQRQVQSKSVEKWVDCFDMFLHPSLNAKAIAESLAGISSIQLPKNERSFWWVTLMVLTEIKWAQESASQKTILQWANLHFNIGWDWRNEQMFKFTIEKKYKVKHSSQWRKMNNAQSSYYADLADTIRELFIKKIEGVVFDRKKFILPGKEKESPNGHVTKE